MKPTTEDLSRRHSEYDRLKADLVAYYAGDLLHRKVRGDWDEFERRPPRWIEEMNLPALVEPAERILDAGCGAGALLIHLQKRFPTKQFFGCDLSPRALTVAHEVARREGADVAFVEADLETRQPFPDADFDLILCHEVLEHLLDPPAVIGRLAAMLAPGGRLLVVAPTLWLRAPLGVRLRKAWDFLRMATSPRYLHLSFREPVLDAAGGDSDAVYWAGPYELWRMLHSAGLRVVARSWVRCRAVAEKPRSSARKP